MKKILICTTFLFISIFGFTVSANAVAFTDPAVLAAILQQTATQTANHLQELAQAIQTVQNLQQQLNTSQSILQIAQTNAQGSDRYTSGRGFS